ncbi:hypothetical protein KIH87_16260 [Paraneptunicella aestuarii]|uniref:hypothetical protein n=1 Tax=Paraneptunicella aestuarii TaxID=2831148 RepID=UPI001E3C2F5C|nr:hypothetical protein [Paraneptunicella aestuarii]UAA38225.1 hypothetical protein KIH87_16260 [Paraneptunicella aestuarii]
MADLSASKLLEALNRIKAPIEAITKATAEMSESFSPANNRLGELSNGMNNAESSTLSLSQKIAKIGVQAAIDYTNKFLDAEDSTKKFMTSLEAIEGSSKKAKEAAEWLTKFSLKTPFDVGKINQTYLDLRNKGIQPTQEMMKALGEVSSATGKELSAVGDIYAKASAGDEQALDDLDVKTTTKGEQITYEYTTKNNEVKTITVDKNNTQEMQQALSQIFDDKYAGSMDKMASTWTGRMTQIMNHWSKFKSTLTDAGITDFLKSKLKDEMTKISDMAAKGELKKYAQDMIKLGQDAQTTAKDKIGLLSRKMRAYNRLMRMSTRRAMPNFRKAMVGAAMNMELLAVSASSSGGIVSRVLGTMVSGLRAVAIAMAANPVGAVVAAIVIAIALAAALIYKFWDPIKAFIGGVVEGLSAAAQPILDAFPPLQPIFSAVGNMIGTVVDAIGSLFEPVQSTSADLESAGNAGKKFGELLAFGINLLVTPITWLVDSILWIADTLGSVGGFIGNLWNKFFGDEEKEISITKKINLKTNESKVVAEKAMKAGNIVQQPKKNEKAQTANQKITQETEKAGDITKKVKQSGEIIPFPQQKQESSASYSKEPSSPDSAEQYTSTQAQVNYEPVRLNASSPAQTTISNHFTINAAPGMSEMEVAHLVEKELNKNAKAAQTQQRAALYDYQEYAIA